MSSDAVLVRVAIRHIDQKTTFTPARRGPMVDLYGSASGE